MEENTKQPIAESLTDTPPLRLNLYDKLWSNITQKENRVWTFLSVYGAAIGIGISTGLANDLQPLTTLVILILTYWAGELIIDTDWWSIRNRTMISRIEEEDTQSTKDIIPSYYRGYKYTASTLYHSSLAVFGFLGLLVVSNTYLAIDNWSGHNAYLAAFIILSYTGWSVIIGRWAHLREKRIDEYTTLYRDLYRKSSVNDSKITAERIKNNLRVEVGVGHLIVALVLLKSVWEHTCGLATAALAAVEISALLVYGVLVNRYWKNKATGFSICKLGKPGNRLNSVLVLLVLALIVLSSTIAGMALQDAADNQRASNPDRSLIELKRIQDRLRSNILDQIDRLERIDSLERSEMAGDIKNLKNGLSRVSGRIDALEQSEVNKEIFELHQILDSVGKNIDKIESDVEALNESEQ